MLAKVWQPKIQRREGEAGVDEVRLELFQRFAQLSGPNLPPLRFPGERMFAILA